MVPGDICLAILAAGGSRRFGAEDKLTADLHGTMLGLHLAHTLAGQGWRRTVVVASSDTHGCAPGWRQLGYELIVNREAEAGLSTSVRCAVQTAMACGAGGLLLCLADMPLVSRAHVEVLLCAGAGEAIVASGAEGQAMPPALFPACQFPSLFELHGDRGARALLHGALLVPFAPGEGIDVDDPAALSRLRSAATSVG